MRWWDAAVLGTAGMLGALLLALTDVPWRIGLGAAGIALLVIAWIALGRRRGGNPRRALWFIVLTVVASGVVVAAYPTLAIVQVIAYPIVWTYSSTMRRAVIANVAVSLSVGVGFIVSLGAGVDNLVQTFFTVALSLAFSLAMGFWISRMTRLGDERGRLLAELQGAQEQIAALHRDSGAAAERERLARDLHDTIAQDLTGLVMLAQRAQRQVAASATATTSSETSVADTLELIEENARAVLAETRALVAAGASVGGDDGLTAALLRLAERFERETGIAVAVEPADGLVLSRDAEVVVLRCVQEALANARKHARASRIAIEVEAIGGYAPDDDARATANEPGPAPRVRVTVTDDGIGFDPEHAPDGFGLTGMTERLALVRGTLSVSSAPGRGARLVAELPTAVTA